mgnify:CR=1 FL=1
MRQLRVAQQLAESANKVRSAAADDARACDRVPGLPSVRRDAVSNMEFTREQMLESIQLHSAAARTGRWGLTVTCTRAMFVAGSVTAVAHLCVAAAGLGASSCSHAPSGWLAALALALVFSYLFDVVYVLWRCGLALPSTRARAEPAPDGAVKSKLNLYRERIERARSRRRVTATTRVPTFEKTPPSAAGRANPRGAGLHEVCDSRVSASAARATPQETTGARLVCDNRVR